MRVEIKDNIRIIKNHSHSLEEIAKLVEDELKSYVDLNLILDVTFNKDFKKKDIKSFKKEFFKNMGKCKTALVKGLVRMVPSKGVISAPFSHKSIFFS